MKEANSALELRESILDAFKDAHELPWPPTAEDMSLSCEDTLPPDLIKFLSFLFTGKDNIKNEKTKRLIYSIGQDICRAVTGGKWRLPKHILLCVTIRHLFRSRQFTTILNKLGHCETYNFALELETDLAKALDEVSSFHTPQILTGDANLVFHTEWDNLNKNLTSIHGNNIVNSAAGIMLQEIKPGFSTSNERVLPTFKRSTQSSKKLDAPETLPPLNFTRVGPKFPEGSVFSPPAENDKEFEEGMTFYYIWLLLRFIGSNGEQIVPAFGGFTSATGSPPLRKTTIDYFTPIHQPITDNAVVKELLKRSEAATAEVGQKWVLNTFDLGVCMKALPIIWRWPNEFAAHVVTVGPFHTAMNFMGRLTGRKMLGSGYAAILTEAHLVRSGSLKGVLSGKAFALALFCLKVICEAMERLLIKQFMIEEEVTLDDPEVLLKLMHSCNKEQLDEVMTDESALALIQKYKDYEEKVSKGHLGKTAAFWVSFIRECHILFMLLLSVKKNNLKLFHKSNGDMAPLFFAYDGQNYSRYLTWLEVHLTNIESTHPGAQDLLTKGGIAVARSMIPGALSAVDKTMEETFMKFAKSFGGFSGLYSQFGAYQRFCRTTSARAKYYQKILDLVDLLNDPDSSSSRQHRELEKAEIRKYEKAVQRTITAIENFTNPFTISDKDRLYCLASGAPVTKDAEADIMRAELVGKEAKADFIDRLRKGEPTSFFDSIKRQKLMTFEASNVKAKLTSSQGNVIQYQAQSNLAFALLVKSQSLEEPLDLAQLMKFCLMPVPPSLGTPDGFFCKTKKATVLHYLLDDTTTYDLQYPVNSLVF